MFFLLSLQITTSDKSNSLIQRIRKVKQIGEQAVEKSHVHIYDEDFEHTGIRMSDININETRLSELV